MHLCLAYLLFGLSHLHPQPHPQPYDSSSFLLYESSAHKPGRGVWPRENEKANKCLSSVRSRMFNFHGSQIILNLEATKSLSGRLLQSLGISWDAQADLHIRLSKNNIHPAYHCVKYSDSQLTIPGSLWIPYSPLAFFQPNLKPLALSSHRGLSQIRLGKKH